MNNIVDLALAQKLVERKKIDVFRFLYQRGYVTIYLDPTVVGVVVPTRFEKQRQLILQVGARLAIPTDNIRVNSERIFVTLSFNSELVDVTIPWNSIFCLMGEEQVGVLWNHVTNETILLSNIAVEPAPTKLTSVPTIEPFTQASQDVEEEATRRRGEMKLVGETQ